MEPKELITTILLVLCACAALIQLIYYWGIFSRLAFHKPKTGYQKPGPVSVIICARNEAKNLKKFLPKVLDQDYFEYEVVVVNDCSFDDSGDILKEMSQKYSNLKVITILEQEKYQHGKKFAVTLGIKGAKYEHLLFTDADCEPEGRNWLMKMQSQFVPGVDIVLGYGPYMRKKGLLNKLIRFDTFINGVQFLSYSLINTPYMGVGRNLAYRKSLFFKNKGFASHYHLLSGDDDLFINEVGSESNTRIEVGEGALTYSEPKTTFAAWVTQKKRHLSTYPLYKGKHKLMLGLYSASTMLFYISLITLLILQFDWQIIAGIYGIRLLTQIIIWFKSMKLLKEMDLLALAPIFDLVLILIYPYLGLKAKFVKNHRWR